MRGRSENDIKKCVCLHVYVCMCVLTATSFECVAAVIKMYEPDCCCDWAAAERVCADTCVYIQTIYLFALAAMCIFGVQIKGYKTH